MRKTNEQKGITLIALIITIIVLLILAVVAIGAITQDGIINHAKNAKQEYGAAQDNESTLLGNYLDKINANVPQTGNGGETPEGTGGAGGAGTGGNQGTTITFTINGTEYTAESGMTLQQWAESDYDVGDNYIYIEKGGYVGIRINDETEYICSENTSYTEYVPGNVPIAAGSAYYYYVYVPQPEPEGQITFYYNGMEYHTNKGTTWENWPDYSQAGLEQADGGYIIMNDVGLICYDDGTWVKADESIRDEHHYTKGLAFSAGIEYYAAKGQTWESWINAFGKGKDFNTKNGEIYASNGYQYLAYEDGKTVKVEDEIIPGYTYTWAGEENMD